jgi:hypothetical protein
MAGIGVLFLSSLAALVLYEVENIRVDGRRVDCGGIATA